MESRYRVGMMRNHGTQRPVLPSSAAPERSESLTGEGLVARQVRIYASPVRPNAMSRLAIVLLWWFAVLDSTGEIALFFYRTQSSCRIVQAAYHRISSVKVTDCTEEDKHEIEGVSNPRM